MDKRYLTQKLRELALLESFDFCRIAPAEYLEQEAPKLEKWLKKGYQGDMSYMERNFDLRLDPRLLVPGARSVIVLAMNYYLDLAPSSPKVSVYAQGRDYHKVIKKKLKNLIRNLQTEFGDFAARGFVDSAPVLERAWAVKSGLGFVGKNGNLIVPKFGSYFFLATIICDLDFEYDTPFKTDHCGSCTRCIDVCPTQAIRPDRQIDGSRCISYYTIETKDERWTGDRPDLDDWLFGCDACQIICPWNRFSKETSIRDFDPRYRAAAESRPWQDWTFADWNQLSEKDFEEVFFDSPIRRKGYQGIKQTLKYLKNENSDMHPASTDTPQSES